MILATVELPVLIIYIVMAIGFIAMVWGAKNQNTKPNARIIMYVAVVVIIGSVVSSFFVSGDKSEDARMLRNVKQFQTAKAEKAASYIANRFPGGSVAFLIDESSMQVPLTEYANSFVLDEMKRRMGEKGLAVGEVLVVGQSKEVVDKSGESTTEIEDPTNPKIMKNTLETVYDQADIVVNFVGLPESVSDLRTITFIARKNTATGKNNMMLLSDLGLPYVDPEMIKSGRICAILEYANDESASFDMMKNDAPKDLEKAFDYQYILLDQNSLSRFEEENEKYFIGTTATK